LENIYNLYSEQSVIISEKKSSRGEITDFINSYIPVGNSYTKYLTTSKSLDIFDLPDVDNIVNFQKINNINWVNTFFRSVNSKLPKGGVFIGCVEIYSQRKARVKKKYPPIIAQLYLLISFFYRRVLPRLSLTKNLYSVITRGNNKAISKAEAFGRLIFCGFEILGYDYIDNLVYFAARKTGEPLTGNKPSFGLLIKLNRVGKEGKLINVYKIRTMHPYSEYLQEFIYKNNNIDKGGKFKDDFRISSWGKIMRKLWLDEIPMILNFLKGDLKLVGIRPLSQHYFNLYPEEYKARRIKYKPGLVPPYYADSPKTLDEITASEIKYLDAYDKQPIITDIKYFFLVFYKIIFKGVRSR